MSVILARMRRRLIVAFALWADRNRGDFLITLGIQSLEWSPPNNHRVRVIKAACLVLHWVKLWLHRFFASVSHLFNEVCPNFRQKLYRKRLLLSLLFASHLLLIQRRIQVYVDPTPILNRCLIKYLLLMIFAANYTLHRVPSLICPPFPSLFPPFKGASNPLRTDCTTSTSSSGNVYNFSSANCYLLHTTCPLINGAFGSHNNILNLT